MKQGKSIPGTSLMLATLLFNFHTAIGAILRKAIHLS